jgi:hypothetical protein
MSRKREYIKLPITKEDINKTMMLHGDHKSIRFWENIIMSKVKHGVLANDREELFWYMNGIVSGWFKKP